MDKRPETASKVGAVNLSLVILSSAGSAGLVWLAGKSSHGGGLLFLVAAALTADATITAYILREMR